jgi:hypothetical protein
VPAEKTQVAAGIIEGAREGPGEPDALIELADGEQSGVAGQLARRRLEDERVGVIFVGKGSGSLGFGQLASWRRPQRAR